jgi:hypothetical protein
VELSSSHWEKALLALILEDSGSLAAERLFSNIAARRALSNLSLVLGTGGVGLTTLFSKEAVEKVS